MGVNGIYGLSGSGLDIESMVKVGMMSRQNQYDKMQQQYTKNEWKKTDLLNIYSTMNTFNTSTLSQYKMSNNMDAHSAESSKSSIKVSATSSAPIMRHNVEVGAAATNAYLIGTNTLDRIGNGASSTSTQLKDVLFSNLETSTATYAKLDGVDVAKDDIAFSFSVGDGVNGGITSTNPKAVTALAGSSATSGEHEVKITSMADSVSLTSTAIKRFDSDTGATNSTSTSTALKDMIFKKIQNNYDGTFTFTNQAGATENKVTTASVDNFAKTDALKFVVGDGESTATISMTYKEIMDGATLDDLATKINDARLKVTAAYDSATDKFSLTNNSTDVANNIITLESNKSDFGAALSANAATFFNGIGLTDSVTGVKMPMTNSGTSIKVSSTVATIDGTAVAFDVNNKYADSATGVTYTATGVGTSTVKVDAEAIEKNTISVTYGQLLDGYTFNDLTSAVNALGQNARMTYDSVNDKFSFYNKDSGESNTVAIAIAAADKGGTAAADFFNKLGLQQSSNGTLSAGAIEFSAGEVSVVAGSNANVKIDGVDYSLSSNKTTVNGVTYDFTNAIAGDKSVVSVDQDKDKILDYVKGFVKDYNELLSTLYKAYDEKPNTNYKPLTDAQKDQMTKEQVEKWEEKAKAGMLYHDQTLGKIIDEIRSSISTRIDGISGSYDSVFSIGISTTGIKGQLTLDEDKLKAALDADSESVYNVFAKLEYKNDATSASGKLQQADNNYSKSGIAQRLSDIMASSMKTVKSVAGSSSSIIEDSDLNNLLRELQTKMSNFKSMMNAFENKLYKKYDAMETMLSGLGVQLNYVTSAFG